MGCPDLSTHDYVFFITWIYSTFDISETMKVICVKYWLKIKKSFVNEDH